MPLIEKTRYKDMPWKNGKGRTAEIDRVPLENPYLWRLSQATVATDSEFSLFPGYDRLLVVTSGAGVFLNDLRLDRLQPHRFSGEAQITCKLMSGEVTDLGLIYDREKIQADMILFTSRAPKVANKNDLLATYVFDLDSGDTHKDAANCPTTNGILVAVFKKNSLLP